MNKKLIYFIIIALLIIAVAGATVLIINSLPKDINATYEGVVWDYGENIKPAVFQFEGKMKKGIFDGTMTVTSEEVEKTFQVKTDKSKDYTFIINCDLSSEKALLGTVLTTIGDKELVIIDDGAAFCAPAKTAEQAEKLLNKYS